MRNLTVKVEANYNTLVADSEDPRVVARVLAIILDEEANIAERTTPEMAAVQALKEELEKLRSELSVVRYNRDELQKKLDAREVA